MRSRKELAESMADFLELPPGEQAFHQALLAFRQVQALADVHASLRRMEGLLGRLDLSALAALKHLAPMRRVQDDIADAQSEILDALEDQAAGEDDDVLEDDEPNEEVVAAPDVVEPEIIEPPPADAPAPRKPRRPRVIDVPSSEAA